MPLRTGLRAPALVVFLAYAGCSSDPGDLGRDVLLRDAGSQDASAADVGVRDAAPAPIDAGSPTDAASMDAAALDATAMDAAALDATAMDAAALDAAAPDAAEPPQCGELGKACTSGNDCSGNHRCVDPPGICVPARVVDCGGFAQARCPAQYPVCQYYTGADYGPCLTAFERDCICATRPGRAGLVGCP